MLGRASCHCSANSGQLLKRVKALRFSRFLKAAKTMYHVYFMFFV